MVGFHGSRVTGLMGLRRKSPLEPPFVGSVHCTMGRGFRLPSLARSLGLSVSVSLSQTSLSLFLSLHLSSLPLSISPLPDPPKFGSWFHRHHQLQPPSTEDRVPLGSESPLTNHWILSSQTLDLSWAGAQKK
jgi:hypothetical protein